MNTARNKNTFPLGLMLFALTLAVYKAAMLAAGMMLGWPVFFILAGLDAFYVALLLLIGVFHGFAGPGVLRTILRLTLVLLTFIYLVDSFVLLALDEHAPLFDIARYSLEPGVVLSFFDARAYSAILMFLISIFFVCEFTPAVKKLGIVLLPVMFLTGGFCEVYAPQPLVRYSMLGAVGLSEGFRPHLLASFYSAEQIKFYAGQEQVTADIPAAKPDIVLVVVESLSSINSKKVSGMDGFLDGFDTLAEEGLLFRNFFANHQASEGGLIALLGGYPPVHFPTATPYMFDEFAIQPSVLGEYRQQGYLTEFLTNSDLRFIGMNHFLDGLGLDRSRGRDDVDAMRIAPRIAQNAPSDALLYHEALSTIHQLSSRSQRFLLTIATASTHLPYKHPEGGPDTAEAVWGWGMQQLARFHRQLTADRYFDHGILIITGDHRQMRPPTKTETERYGGSARARVPLLVIGNGYPRDEIDDRFFQQSDLLRMLGKIQQPEVLLSPQPIWVERYNRKYGRIELIDSLSVFDEADLGRHEYRLKASGNRIEWLDEKPGFARRVENRIHAQRSLHQQVRGRANGQ